MFRRRTAVPCCLGDEQMFFPCFGWVLGLSSFPAPGEISSGDSTVGHCGFHDNGKSNFGRCCGSRKSDRPWYFAVCVAAWERCHGCCCQRTNMRVGHFINICSGTYRSLHRSRKQCRQAHNFYFPARESFSHALLWRRWHRVGWKNEKPAPELQFCQEV